MTYAGMKRALLIILVAGCLTAGFCLFAPAQIPPQVPLSPGDRAAREFQDRNNRDWNDNVRRRNNEQPGRQSAGPWHNDLMIRRGDGSRFENESVLVPAAGVPSAIRLLDGRIIMAFQWFPQDEDDKAHWDKVAVIISHDTGRTWTEPLPITVRGLPEGYQRPFDPTLALLPDGRIRCYFSSGPKPAGGRKGLDSNIGAHSAISMNGIAYDYETGPILTTSGSGPMIDPAMLLVNDVWHYIAPITGAAPAEENGAYHATSTDGLLFMREPDLDPQRRNWTGNLIRWNQGMRFYGGGRDGIWWCYSSDGGKWTKPRDISVKGGDPTLVETGEGDYFLIYVGMGRGGVERKGEPE